MANRIIRRSLSMDNVVVLFAIYSYLWRLCGHVGSDRNQIPLVCTGFSRVNLFVCLCILYVTTESTRFFHDSFRMVSIRFAIISLRKEPFEMISFVAFMVMDTGYEDRFFGPDSDRYISLYPVLFVIFLLFGVTMTILVNNLLTGEYNRMKF